MIGRIAILFLLTVQSLYCCTYAIEKNGESKTVFINETQLDAFFEKLYQLQQTDSGKVNIVHIGDSHIQADMLTNATRTILQSQFGNGGYGFTFPYSLAGTNGTNIVKYTSGVDWDSRRNIYPTTDIEIGLSGIALYSKGANLEISLNTNSTNSFTKIKVISPEQSPRFEVSFSGQSATQTTAPVVQQPKVNQIRKSTKKVIPKQHTVQSGETLYRISLNNKISVDELKQLNNLTTNTIRTGMVLQLPGEEVLVEEEVEEIVVPQSPPANKVVPQSRSGSKRYMVEYTVPKPVNAATISSGNQPECSLSGIVLENNQSGIIYHSIGVNGARLSDYNKYPLFFEQLPVLEGDLFIISLGTNEAFGKLSVANYMKQLDRFAQQIRKNNPQAVIMVVTPPPALVKRRTPNEYLEMYREALVTSKGYVIWDMLKILGGINAPKSKAFSDYMAKDKIHYTREGYRMQGELLATALLSAFDTYKTNRKK